MKHCVKCGEEIQDDAKFCPHCGTKQEESPTLTLDSDLDHSLSKISEELSDVTEDLNKDTAIHLTLSDDELTVPKKDDENDIELKLDSITETFEDLSTKQEEEKEEIVETEKTIVEEPIVKEEKVVKVEEEVYAPETTVWSERNENTNRFYENKIFSTSLSTITKIATVIAVIYFVFNTINVVATFFYFITGYYELNGIFDYITTIIAYLGYTVVNLSLALISAKIITGKVGSSYLPAISGMVAACEIKIGFGLFEYICARIVGYTGIDGLTGDLVVPIVIVFLLYYFIEKDGAEELNDLKLRQIITNPIKNLTEGLKSH